MPGDEQLGNGVPHSSSNHSTWLLKGKQRQPPWASSTCSSCGRMGQRAPNRNTARLFRVCARLASPNLSLRPVHRKVGCQARPGRVWVGFVLFFYFLRRTLARRRRYGVAHARQVPLLRPLPFHLFLLSSLSACLLWRTAFRGFPQGGLAGSTTDCVRLILPPCAGISFPLRQSGSNSGIGLVSSTAIPFRISTGWNVKYGH